MRYILFIFLFSLPFQNLLAKELVFVIENCDPSLVKHIGYKNHDSVEPSAVVGDTLEVVLYGQGGRRLQTVTISNLYSRQVNDEYFAYTCNRFFSVPVEERFSMDSIQRAQFRSLDGLVDFSVEIEKQRNLDAVTLQMKERPRINELEIKSFKIFGEGDPASSFDLVFISEGFTREELLFNEDPTQSRFVKESRKMARSLMNVGPFVNFLTGSMCGLLP